MALPRMGPLLLVLTVLGGCTYVFPDQVKNKIACLDEDGDGFYRRADCSLLQPGQPADCDDNDPDRYPGNTEIPYDGIDQNCDLQDLVDVDGDRYPGIAQSDWVSHNTGVTWPTGLLSNSDPKYTAIDCNDNDPTVFPGSGAEVHYDGVNSACVASPTYDDWDADGDGYALAARLLPPGAKPYTGSLPQTDCDDTDPTVSPGTSKPDIWYDGIDQNCDGHDDFDQDGDGYIPDRYIVKYHTFMANYKYPDTRTCTAEDGSCNDCDDDPTNDGSQPVPAKDIHPGATETWYDGIDQDCAGDDDFDQDKDGYDCDGSVVEACSGHQGTDCADTDPSINPSALELLGDNVDSDCVSGPDGANFATGNYAWTNPGFPAVTANDQHYLLAVTADQYTFQGTPHDFPGMVFTLPLSTAIPTDTPTPELLEDSDPISKTASLLPDGLDFWFGTTISDTQSDGTLLDSDMRVQHPEWTDAFNDYLKGVVSTQQFATTTVNNGCAEGGNCVWDDFDLQSVDSGGTFPIEWLVACAEDAVQYLQVQRTGTLPSTTISRLDNYGLTTPAGHACYVDIDPENSDLATLHAYSNDSGTYGYHEFTLNTQVSPPIQPVASPTDPTATWAVDDVHHHPDGSVVFAGSDAASTPEGVMIIDSAVLSQPTAAAAFDSMRTYSADAALQGSTWYVAAVVDHSGTPELLFTYGTDLASLKTPIQLTMPNDATPIGVSVYADADRLIVAATGKGSSAGTDVFGWAMWGYAP